MREKNECLRGKNNEGRTFQRKIQRETKENESDEWQLMVERINCSRMAESNALGESREDVEMSFLS